MSTAYQEMVYCPVSNSSSQKPFVVHGNEGFEPRRADDEFSTHFLIGQYNSQLFEAMINLTRGPLEE